MLRPPTTLWGYNMQVTDEAMDRIARALRDRDIEIAYLQRQLADLGHTDYQAARAFVPKHERPPASEPDLERPPEAEDHNEADEPGHDDKAEAEELGW
jgi:hypothetical protein